MCDAKSGLPIYEVTLTGEKADVSSLINFLDKINSWFSLKIPKFSLIKVLILKQTIIT